MICYFYLPEISAIFTGYFMLAILGTFLIISIIQIIKLSFEIKKESKELKKDLNELKLYIKEHPERKQEIIDYLYANFKE